jgi:alpha-D-xyloside xylohydrolase
MLRAMMVEFPEDPGAWQVDNAYMFGADILVAPLLESGIYHRNVYLPKGKWIDYQSGTVYNSGWHDISAGALPIIMLVRDGAVIPHIGLAQSTQDMDWRQLDLRVFSSTGQPAEGKVCLPADEKVMTIRVVKKGKNWVVQEDVSGGKVKWVVKL